MFDFRTDLADERMDVYNKSNKEKIKGIESSVREDSDKIKVTTVKVIDESGQSAIGKPIGDYITIDVKSLKIATENEIEKVAESLSIELKKLINKHVKIADDILVVGLGNIYVTPDSLGPKVVSEIDITRHILEYMPGVLETSTRPVSAIATGVLGTTGIETLEILKGVVENIKPKLVIVIDALASRSIERISSTIQLADTGIAPGAGVGNKRKELTEETLGIPVIAIGVPTVVDVATIATDSLNMFINKFDKKDNDGLENLYESIKKISEEDKYEMIKEVLVPNDYNLIVTPKEIDELIDNMSSIVARGINMSL